MEAPGAAAADAHFACRNCSSRTTRQHYFSRASQYDSRAIGWRADVVALITILHPFLDISVNVVETKRVRLKRADINRMLLPCFPAKVNGIRVRVRLCSAQRVAR